MRIIVHTQSPKRLYDNINYRFENGESNTWEKKLNFSGEILYNHTPDQWSEKILLKPKSHIQGLEFLITYNSEYLEPETNEKGYIIGSFVEFLMVNFQGHFSKLEIVH